MSVRLTEEEIREAGLSVDNPIAGARLSRLQDVALFEPEPDPDFVIAERNRHYYRTQRGRTCEYPECTAKIRYTRTVPVCGKHELTEFAAVHPAATERLGIYPTNPTLHGLRNALEETGISTRELALKIGRSQKWVQRIARAALGVDGETRAQIAEALGVSEPELLEYPEEVR